MREITSTEKIANELLIERYEPIGVCGTQQFDMHELQGIILDSFDDVDIMMGSFDKVEKFMKDRYND